VIEVCHAYVVAQREYAPKKALGPGGSVDLCTHFMSKAGHRDGLYWPPNRTEDAKFRLGPLIASARPLVTALDTAC